MPLRAGDVLIIRVPDHSFRIRIAGGEVLPEQYATFGMAAVKGEELAVTNRVRLFVQDSPTGTPRLLMDASRWASWAKATRKNKQAKKGKSGKRKKGPR